MMAGDGVKKFTFLKSKNENINIDVLCYAFKKKHVLRLLHKCNRESRKSMLRSHKIVCQVYGNHRDIQEISSDDVSCYQTELRYF